MDGETLAGIIELGEPQEGIANINHSSVSRSHRRRGISTALKVEAVHWGQRQKLTELHTQNHFENPILQINLDFGFVQKRRQFILEKSLNLEDTLDTLKQ